MPPASSPGSSWKEIRKYLWRCCSSRFKNCSKDCWRRCSRSMANRTCPFSHGSCNRSICWTNQIHFSWKGRLATSSKSITGSSSGFWFSGALIVGSRRLVHPVEVGKGEGISIIVKWRTFAEMWVTCQELECARHLPKTTDWCHSPRACRRQNLES